MSTQSDPWASFGVLGAASCSKRRKKRKLGENRHVSARQLMAASENACDIQCLEKIQFPRSGDRRRNPSRYFRLWKKLINKYDWMRVFSDFRLDSPSPPVLGGCLRVDAALTPSSGCIRSVVSPSHHSSQSPDRDDPVHWIAEVKGSQFSREGSKAHQGFIV